jgi:hypothetical protein
MKKKCFNAKGLTVQITRKIDKKYKLRKSDMSCLKIS